MLQISIAFIIGTDLLKSGTSLTELKTLNNQTSHYTKDFFATAITPVKNEKVSETLPHGDLRMAFLAKFSCVIVISINWKKRKITDFYLNILKC